ncbi:MAG: putative baseplate assembly protein [Thermoanaerobaculia bacterium]
MTTTIRFATPERVKAAVLAETRLNGIDFVDAIDGEELVLRVSFIRTPVPRLEERRVIVSRGFAVKSVAFEGDELVVALEGPADSPLVLRLVSLQIDPALASIEISFRGRTVTASRFFCCDEGRRDAILAQTVLDGIDYLEVIDHDEPVLEMRQRVLRVKFIRGPAPALQERNVVIEGGERIRGITGVPAAPSGDAIDITVDRRGDFTPYLLRLVDDSGTQPFPGLDPLLSSVEFSFKVECDTPFDCRDDTACLVAQEPGPRIDYLAKDYSTFRRLMLDRLALLLPDWTERNPSDLGITLVEMLAYVADHLSYEQDAVATEAYLGTARRRTSVRRHARLVDYRMHDGCNARAFVQLQATADGFVAAKAPLFTKIDGFDPRIAPADEAEALQAAPLVFETMHDLRLRKLHNAMPFYTWQSDECCLPRGATSATLAGHYPHLEAGDLLVFLEKIGPRNGVPEDANPAHRHAVRLTRVNAAFDVLTKDGGSPVAVTEIEWHEEDALPFPLCISARIKGMAVEVSVALGNIVLADHGATAPAELGRVPKPSISLPPAPSAEACSHEAEVAVPVRFRPRLPSGPLTQRGLVALPTPDDPEPHPFDPGASAASALRWDMSRVMPDIGLRGTLEGVGEDWEVRADLYESDDRSPHFVAEVEEDGIATLRFGDDQYGRRPAMDTVFEATYRVGNGTSGNVGADAIAHVVTVESGIDGVRNPLPARGGVEPEALEHARESAPAAFRIQERAVTESDYAEVTQRREGVDRAAATFRWTGSWYTVFDTVDRRGGLPVDDAYRAETRAFLERYRVVGHDLEVDAPRFVPLDVALTVCVKPPYFRADVLRELLDVFSRGLRRDGQPGFFHPDRFTFGGSVYLSRILAAAQSVQGVDGVTVSRFRRQGFPASESIETGELELARLEIARLDNSRDFPENGRLELMMRGGR